MEGGYGCEEKEMQYYLWIDSHISFTPHDAFQSSKLILSFASTARLAVALLLRREKMIVACTDNRRASLAASCI